MLQIRRLMMVCPIKQFTIETSSNKEALQIFPVALTERFMITSLFISGRVRPCFFNYYTSWFDNLKDLDKVDWKLVYERIWKDTVNDMDRQRRKQAEFLVYQFCGWAWIEEIGVINQEMKSKVDDILSQFPENMKRPVIIKPEWYY